MDVTLSTLERALEYDGACGSERFIDFALSCMGMTKYREQLSVLDRCSFFSVTREGLRSIGLNATEQNRFLLTQTRFLEMLGGDYGLLTARMHWRDTARRAPITRDMILDRLGGDATFMQWVLVRTGLTRELILCSCDRITFFTQTDMLSGLVRWGCRLVLLRNHCVELLGGEPAMEPLMYVWHQLRLMRARTRITYV